ncbi:hypothetical protein ETD96_24065 [Actinomadura geliboluensis]|uniref:TrbC/VIRB2 family protein n=1 Tax=Actinomadura geliboluensis TaxID=882440 RepID=A0A5S4GR14_9ACTN|nr:hypothetical protein ETD96_24065 [Actinomadura geliboluensis]
MHTRNRPPRPYDRPQSLGPTHSTARLAATHCQVKRPCGRGRLVAASLLWTAGCGVSALFVPGVAEAGTGLAEAASLDEVITNLRNVIVGLLVGLATLFATIGGVRYMLAGGDPGEVEAAKKTLRYAAVGYSVAVLAPLLVKILQGIVGAPS